MKSCFEERLFHLKSKTRANAWWPLWRRLYREASLQANEYALAAARAKLDYTLIRAPFSGAIQRLDTEVGELAAPGKVLLELVVTSPLKAVFSVPQKDLAEIREGMEVRLIVPSLDK
ncbi:MAG: HlyD family efflux transporter periplasmic adaptor subunit, partial [Deltaproteobacteria bacterium]|nr:HlyD family efflux transporter periplasmic adaptor subunit [Deltaproteobacteria bacterium]